jgi:NAD(P)-dependent dehydrogenase (short-subunit alcohol dehydrogenase family)
MNEQKVAIVTGANTGIGEAIADRLSRDGWSLGYATRKDDDESRSVYERLQGRGPVSWTVGDLSDPAVPARIAKETLDAFGRVDLLVNNAGLTSAKPALELTADDFDTIFAVDVRASFLLAQAVAPSMRDRGGGSIVNITSVHEHIPRPGFTFYASAKAALGMLTRSLALEWGEYGIRVNAVAPGVIATPRNEADADELNPEVPLGRPGKPEEVAALVAWLGSDEAAYVNGSSYVMDGGMIQQVVSKPAES